MADGPAGIRLRQWYEVDKETDSIYEMGVLGSLENRNSGNLVCIMRMQTLIISTVLLFR